MEPIAAEGVIFLVFEAELGTKNSFNILCLDASKIIIYRSGTVNSKSFVGKVFLRIKRKFELTYAL